MLMHDPCARMTQLFMCAVFRSPFRMERESFIKTSKEGQTKTLGHQKKRCVFSKRVFHVQRVSIRDHDHVPTPTGYEPNC